MNKELRNYILSLAEKKLRNNKRALNEFRPVSVETGVSKNAEGSAMVRIGNSVAIAGVKMDIGKPFSDTPNKGNLMCGAELSPISDSDFEPGPPGENAIELSRVIDRGIRESGAIDLEKLCIVKGKQVWNIFIDIYIFNNDGNLIDTCGLAAIAALKSAKIPKLEKKKGEKEYRVVLGEWSKEKMPIKELPIPITFAKIGNNLIADPDKDEEEVSDARITITCTDKNVNAMQKGGAGAFNPKEIESCVEESFKIREKLTELIKTIK